MSKCRTCGAPIRWVFTAEKKTAIPLDVEPREDGNLEIVANGSREYAYPIGLATPADAPRYVAHFATCPDAEAWRR